MILNNPVIIMTSLLLWGLKWSTCLHTKCLINKPVKCLLNNSSFLFIALVLQMSPCSLLLLLLTVMIPDLSAHFAKLLVNKIKLDIIVLTPDTKYFFFQQTIVQRETNG